MSSNLAKPQRTLDLADLDAAIAEARRLHERGYTKAGQWDLAQVCGHCTIPIDGGIDGFQIKVPFPIVLLVRVLGIKKRILKQRRMRTGAPAPAELIVPAGTDEAEAIEALSRSVARFKAHRGPLHKHPIFGAMTHDEWAQLLTIHTAHHLAFLHPIAS
jgi:hypothetical protein